MNFTRKRGFPQGGFEWGFMGVFTWPHSNSVEKPLLTFLPINFFYCLDYILRGRVDYGSVADIVVKKRVAYSCQKEEYPILGGRSRFWEGRIYRCLRGGGGTFREEGIDYGRVAWKIKRVVYSGREGWIMEVSHIVVKKG